METITITEAIKTKFNLPAKAVGTWAITNRADETCTLHILKQDGTLGSNRSGNIYNIATDVLNAILPKPKIEELNIGIRKQRWVEQLLDLMLAVPTLKALIEKQGRTHTVMQILKDTDPARQGGKAYSSISSALKVWNNRALKGDI